jgi:hypothetical protein
MAETTHSSPAATDAPGAEASTPELAPMTKVTRARATTSDVPRKTSRQRAAAPATPDATPAAPTPAAPTPAAPGPTDSAAVAPAAVATLLDSPARPANVELYQGGADSVAADNVRITQGGASVVNARSVEVRQGGIANAQADDITVSMGGIALARADRMSVEMGGVGIAFAREAHLTQGGARSVIAQDVHVDQGLIGTAIAGKVTFERPSGVFLLLAGRTDGPVKALLDWRGALAFGAAFGLLVGLVRRR